MAFFRVELGGEDIVLNHGGGEVDTVMAATGHVGVFAWLGMVAVHEVEARVLVNAVPHGVVNILFDLIPAHVRDFQAHFTVVQLIAEKAYVARYLFR